jgi:hypothetical protein
MKTRRATKSNSPKMRELTAREIYLQELVVGSPCIIEQVESSQTFTIIGAWPLLDINVSTKPHEDDNG